MEHNDSASLAIEYGDSVKALKRAKLDHDQKHEAAVMAAAEVVTAQRRANAARRLLNAAMGVAEVA